jgi:pimeloyl-ACP methyl ester carboxylesterase
VTASHRGGSGSPLVLLHGLGGSWRVWRPVLPALEASHDVVALTLPGHHGGAPLERGAPVSVPALADGVERSLDALGIGRAHLAGNSLGGWLALELARRGRADSVVALSPAGGWARPRDLRRVARLVAAGHASARRARALRLEALLGRPRLRHLALRSVMERGDLVSRTELAALLDDSAGCAAFAGFIAWVRTADPIASWPTNGLPVRIAWAARDRTIPFERYGRPILAALPDAEHVTLPGVGHVPMFDDPGLTARTILEVTDRRTTMSTDIPHDGLVVRRWDPADGARRIVLLLHGYGEHAGRYDHVGARLAADGAVVYAPDHRGHGRSEGEPALVEDMEALVDDAAAVLARARTEHPGLPATVLGHSMGGIIATRLAQRPGQDLAALVLSGPAIGGNPDIEALLGMDPIPDVPIDPAALSRNPSVGEAYATDPLVYSGPFKRATLEALFAGVKAIAEGPSLGALPTLWIHGENDPLAPLGPTREAIERIRGSQLEERIYPGALHEVLNETNSEEVLNDVAAFLATAVEPARA